VLCAALGYVERFTQEVEIIGVMDIRCA